MILRYAAMMEVGNRIKVMFTMTSYEDKVYVGAVPDTKLDELFDQKY